MTDTSKMTCGILLDEMAYLELSPALDPYVQEGRTGKYIYGSECHTDGFFIHVTIPPSFIKGAASDTMVICIPVRFVKFMAWSSSKEPWGFAR
ncbi:MAG: hypothetical protein A4E65_02391 [Syntrophorhabdus sp. PtaU1.Bin153]|nr:MAG: hypothetical protein A4E65_02391 [Syntrophorhabdus sp. PtaU1.Bin153]